MNETQNERYLEDIFVKLCQRLDADGVSIGRATLYFNTRHPQWLGARIVWLKESPVAQIDNIEYGVETTPAYLDSPMAEIGRGSPEVRQRLGPHLSTAPSYPLYAELSGEGYTDYVAWPLLHTQGGRHSVTFASDRRDGFTGNDIDYLADLLPALSLVSEIRLKNRLARTLLDTYVGPHASEQILAGATRRGSGVAVEAAILVCDLRGFTAISDRWARDDVIALLNSYFDVMSGPIDRHGGEVLKIMGDGLLAIFPLSNPDACTDLLQAITEAQVGLNVLNDEIESGGHERVRHGMGVHVGEVMYGNIGSQQRLDFTVIGPAVNVASRLESLTKDLGRSVLLSGAFVEMAACHSLVENLGSHTLRGLDRPVEVYAFDASES